MNIILNFQAITLLFYHFPKVLYYLDFISKSRLLNYLKQLTLLF